jgi:hypothetical protein
MLGAYDWAFVTRSASSTVPPAKADEVLPILDRLGGLTRQLQA